ncbi:hypothetical protein CsatB_019908 [Cannabis sativa]
MYVTRPMSMYRREAETMSITPELEGPHSGYLVMFNEEDYDDQVSESCCGCSGFDRLRNLPLPQNKILRVEHDDDLHKDVVFIPVLNHPLSSNRYYAIVPHGDHTGKAYTNSKEKNMSTSCFSSNKVKDVKPMPLDPFDQNQQVEITCHNDYFSAKAIAASDGFPINFLRKKHLIVRMYPPYYKLRQALGLNAALRGALPLLNNDDSTTLIVGKWYCPFMFVEEVMKLKDQVKRSMFYEMTLEQRWVRVSGCKKLENESNNTVFVNVVLETENVFVEGLKAICDEGNVNTKKVVWFRSCERVGEEYGIGLNVVIVERMKWEQERVGWVSNGGKGSVVKEYNYDGLGEWTSFGCYILVESFVLRRMDRTLAFTYDFKHTHQIRCKWE